MSLDGTSVWPEWMGGTHKLKTVVNCCNAVNGPNVHHVSSSLL